MGAFVNVGQVQLDLDSKALLDCGDLGIRHLLGLREIVLFEFSQHLFGMILSDIAGGGLVEVFVLAGALREDYLFADVIEGA